MFLNGLNDDIQFQLLKKISNEKKWLSALEGKLVSYMRFCELLIPYMQSKGFGRIINIAGISGSEPSESLFVPGVINAAIDNFTKSLANICGSHGVTVNCINPGFIRSSRFDDYMSHVYSERQLRATEELIELIPLKRLGTPNDVASIACFIASTRASYVNGASIPVDGGFRRGI
ncbi:MAG: SDR family oxidoreductase [Acidihalobacter sp.]